MNKYFVFFFCLLFFITDATISYNNRSNINLTNIKEDDMRVVYISYLEYLDNFLGNSATINKAKIDKMINVIESNGFNTIMLHVSPFSDSIYKSKIFPYSNTLTGVEGKNPGFDYLEYFIKKSNVKGIKVHAWINPYRISFSSDINSISKNNPAYKLLKTTSVYKDKKGIYYNPASPIVKNIIIEQVKEIINNYDVDGIHFDDYFYIQDDIDKQDYQLYKANGGNLSLKKYREENINDLIKQVYKVVKKKNILFSIAPDGNINNNYLYHSADVKTWLKNDGYVDIIMPQLYYGFKNEYLPFEKALNNWISLCQNKNIKIVPILAYYKLGKTDLDAGIGKNEWINDKEIINKQIRLIKDYNLYGYGAFRYDFLSKRVNK